MVKLTDGKKTVEITLAIWEGTQYSPDFAADFFEVGGLAYDEDLDAYMVPDVDYCIDYALDWKNSRGDFADDEPNENNAVIIDGCAAE